MRETCFRCKHADFKTNLDTPMRGFAKCAKARKRGTRWKKRPTTHGQIHVLPARFRRHLKRQ